MPVGVGERRRLNRDGSLNRCPLLRDRHSSAPRLGAAIPAQQDGCEDPSREKEREHEREGESHRPRLAEQWPEYASTPIAIGV